MNPPARAPLRPSMLIVTHVEVALAASASCRSSFQSGNGGLQLGRGLLRNGVGGWVGAAAENKATRFWTFANVDATISTVCVMTWTCLAVCYDVTVQEKTTTSAALPLDAWSIQNGMAAQKPDFPWHEASHSPVSHHAGLRSLAAPTARALRLALSRLSVAFSGDNLSVSDQSVRPLLHREELLEGHLVVTAKDCSLFIGLLHFESADLCNSMHTLRQAHACTRQLQRGWAGSGRIGEGASASRDNRDVPSSWRSLQCTLPSAGASTQRRTYARRSPCLDSEPVR
jgi:hypothetical protein